MKAAKDYANKITVFEKSSTNNRENRFSENIKNLQARSITPDTHKTRTFIKNDNELRKFVDQNPSSKQDLSQQISSQKEEKLNQEQSQQIEESKNQEDIGESDYQYYIDEYQYQNSNISKVTHFGVNVYNKELQEKLLKFNVERVKNKTLENKQDQNKVLSAKSSKKSGKVEQLSKIELLFEEEVIIKNATLFLDKEKTILIDILAKTSDDLCVIFQGGIPETHTVVLYKNSTGIIFIIDPSNSQFSRHLSKEGIETLKEDIKIYQPYSSTKGLIGPQEFQWRDCVDIAVKIAFCLNNDQEIYNSLDDLIKSEAIKCISNNDNFNESFISDKIKNHFLQIPLRIQQKSDVSFGQKFYFLSKKVKEKLLTMNNNDLQKDSIQKYFTQIESFNAQQDLNLNVLSKFYKDICTQDL